MTTTGMRRRAALVLSFLLLAAGCGTRGGAPRLALGTPCATCGMEVRDARYAGASVEGRSIRPYDSIECALRDLSTARSAAAAPPAGTPVPDPMTRIRSLYLADYATGALHRSDSLWIVHADIASPMGGGLAAFLDRAEAARIAETREGRVMPIDSLLPAPEATP